MEAYMVWFEGILEKYALCSTEELNFTGKKVSDIVEGCKQCFESKKHYSREQLSDLVEEYSKVLEKCVDGFEGVKKMIAQEYHKYRLLNMLMESMKAMKAMPDSDVAWVAENEEKLTSVEADVEKEQAELVFMYRLARENLELTEIMLSLLKLYRESEAGGGSILMYQNGRLTLEGVSIEMRYNTPQAVVENVSTITGYKLLADTQEFACWQAV